MFAPMDETMLARVEASLAAAADIKTHHMQSHHTQQFKSDIYASDTMAYMNPAKPQFSFNGKRLIIFQMVYSPFSGYVIMLLMKHAIRIKCY